MRVVLILCFAAATCSASSTSSIGSTAAFAPPTSALKYEDSLRDSLAREGQDAGCRPKSVQLDMVDPSVVDLSIAVASAAAGVASQFPRISELEEQRENLKIQLQRATSNLTSAEQTMQSRINELEDAVFKMDQEFEAQTDRVKKRYDDTLKTQLETLTAKLKQQYASKADEIETKYENQLKQQEGKLNNIFLQSKAKYMAEFGEARKEELKRVLAQQEAVENANQELEQALAKSRREIDKLRKRTSKNRKRRFFLWPFRG